MLSPKVGNKSDSVWCGLITKSFPSWPQLPPLHISTTSQVPPAHPQPLQITSKCLWCQKSLPRGHTVHPDSCLPCKAHSVLSSRKPGTPVTSPIRVLITWGHNCPPHCSFRNVFTHFYPCNSMLGTWRLSQCWLTEQLRAWHTAHLGSLKRMKECPLVLHGHPASTLL